MKDWKFDQEPNCGAITYNGVMSGKYCIVCVVHNLDDNGWQFFGNGPDSGQNVAILTMQQVVNIDPSVEEVAHIEPGWKAYRETKDSAWKIEKILD